MESNQDERILAAVAHAAGPVGALFSVGLLGFLAPLIIWILKRGESAFLDDQGKEALNFQLTLFLVFALSIVFLFFTLGLGILVAIPIWAALWILEVVFGIVAAIEAYGGKAYRYPLTLRLIS